MPGSHFSPESNQYELFIAAPMSALHSSHYGAGRNQVLEIIDRLAVVHQIRDVYFAGASISDVQMFTGPAESLRRDLTALRNARLFVLIYPSKVVTSALVEVGYALALRLPSLLLVRDKSDLPYFLGEAEQIDLPELLPPLRIAPLAEPEDAARKIASFRDLILRRGQ